MQTKARRDEGVCPVRRASTPASLHGLEWLRASARARVEECESPILAACWEGDHDNPFQERTTRRQFEIAVTEKGFGRAQVGPEDLG